LEKGANKHDTLTIELRALVESNMADGASKPIRGTAPQHSVFVEMYGALQYKP